MADLCLIPKPSKPSTGPEALRPISLTHPISKALSIILNNHIKPQLWRLVADLPQMAYLENRSAQDALDRASAHCPRVRAVLRAQRQDKISIYADRGTGRLNAEEASYCPLTFDRLLMSCRDPDLRRLWT